jgi:SAM-dependent MidA family methyltransferase
LGIDARAAALIVAHPGAAEDVKAARDRLVEASEMGSLFKVLAVTNPDWPVPEGTDPLPSIG